MDKTVTLSFLRFNMNKPKKNSEKSVPVFILIRSNREFFSLVTALSGELTDLMELSPYWTASSRLPNQEIWPILWNPPVRYGIKEPARDPIMRHTNPHVLNTLFSQNPFSLLPSHLFHLLSDFRNKILFAFLSSPTPFEWSSISSSWIWSPG
jgi:hypothetical protein